MKGNVTRIIGLLDSDEPKLQKDAVRRAVGIKNSRLIPYLIPLLSDHPSMFPKELSRRWREGEPSPFPLLHLAMKVKCRATRIQAIALAGDIGAAFAARDVRRFLESTDAWEREAAAYSLGKMGDRESEQILSGLLDSDTETIVRCACADALGRILGPGAIAGIVISCYDRDEYVRGESRKLLKGMGCPLAEAISFCMENGHAQNLPPEAFPAGIAKLRELRFVIQQAKRASMRRGDEELGEFSTVLAHELYPQWSAVLGRLLKARREKGGRTVRIPPRIPRHMRRNWRREASTGKRMLALRR